MDIIILDMEVDEEHQEETLLVFKIPFLAISGVLIDIKKGMLTMRVKHEQVSPLMYINSWISLFK